MMSAHRDPRSSVLGSPPSGEATERSEDRSRSDTDLGDVVIVLLAGTLAGLRDRLAEDGFPRAAELVAEMTELCDDYLSEVT